MDISVSRYLFYVDPLNGQHLRFGEHSPHKHDEEGAVCNCTRSVTERPEGKPGQVKTGAHVKEQEGQYKVEMALNKEGAVRFTIRGFGDHVYEFGNKEHREENHAYFWFSDPNNLRLEVTGTGRGAVNCSFGDVFFGNKIDISKRMDGHKPSKIIDLSKITPDQIWTHACSWGKEAVEMFPDNEETQGWWHIRSQVEALGAFGFAVLGDHEVPVEGIRASLMASEEFAQAYEQVQEWLLSILGDFKNTTLFQGTDSVQQAIGR